MDVCEFKDPLAKFSSKCDANFSRISQKLAKKNANLKLRQTLKGGKGEGLVTFMTLLLES